MCDLERTKRAASRTHIRAFSRLPGTPPQRLERPISGAGLKLLITLTIGVAAGAFGAGDATAADSLKFIDVTSKWGFSRPNSFGNPEKSVYILETTGTGAAVFDFDNDGDNDVFLANGVTLDEHRSGGGNPSMLYRNDGDGRFVDIAAQAGLGKIGWAQGVCVGDYDNDGNADLLVAYHGVDTLYRNRGGGRFVDATAKAGLPAKGVRWGAGCAFLDYDQDGYLDLFISNYVDLTLDQMPEPGSSPSCYWKSLPVFCGPRSLPKARNWLYRNRGDGTFQDVSAKAGILAPGKRFSLGVLAADFNNDGRTDIYVACDQSPSLLYENQGDGTFLERGTEAGVAYNFHGALQAGMGVAAADYDGNGFLDIVKTNFQGDLPSLYVNEDGIFYEDLAQAAGLGAHKLLGWGVLFHDFDADGRPDILMAHGHIYPEIDGAGLGESYRQPTVLYRNQGDGRFLDVTATVGPALQTPRPARGMAAGDLDGDGRPEIVIVNVNAKPTILKTTGASGAFLSLRLEGTKSNRSAIGARVEVEAAGVRQIQDVLGGGSYFSQSDLALYFGLAEAAQADRLVVKWPSGKTQTFHDIAAGHRYHLIEGGKPTLRP